MDQGRRINFRIPCYPPESFQDITLEVCECGSLFEDLSYPIGAEQKDDAMETDTEPGLTNANIEQRSTQNILDYSESQLQLDSQTVIQKIPQSVPMRRASSYDSREIKNLNEVITCLHKEHKTPEAFGTKKKMRGAEQSVLNAAQTLAFPGSIKLSLEDVASARANVNTGDVATKAKTGCGYDQRLEIVIAALFNIYIRDSPYIQISKTPNIDTMPWLIYIATDDIYSRYVDTYINQEIFRGFHGRNFNEMIQYIRAQGYPQGEYILQYFHDTKFGQNMLPYMRRDYMDILIELTTRPDLVMPFVLTSYPQSSGIMGDKHSNNIIVDHWANIVFKGYKCIGPFLYTNPETREQNQICFKMPIYGIRTAWGQGGPDGFYFLPTSNHFTLFELIELFCYLCSDSRSRTQPLPRLKELFNAAFFRPEAAKTHRGPYDTPENVCGRACRYSDKSMKDLNLSFLKVPTRDENGYENGDENVMDLLTNLIKQDFVVKELTVAIKRDRGESGGRAKRMKKQTKRRRKTNKKQRMKKYDKKRKTNKRRCKKSRRI